MMSLIACCWAAPASGLTRFPRTGQMVLQLIFQSCPTNQARRVVSEAIFCYKGAQTLTSDAWAAGMVLEDMCAYSNLNVGAFLVDLTVWD